MCLFYRGLHDFLYSDEEDHGATASDGSVELFDGSSLYEVRWCFYLYYCKCNVVVRSFESDVLVIFWTPLGLL